MSCWCSVQREIESQVDDEEQRLTMWNSMRAIHLHSYVCVCVWKVISPREETPFFLVIVGPPSSMLCTSSSVLSISRGQKRNICSLNVLHTLIYVFFYDSLLSSFIIRSMIWAWWRPSAWLDAGVVRLWQHHSWGGALGRLHTHRSDLVSLAEKLLFPPPSSGPAGICQFCLFAL